MSGRFVETLRGAVLPLAVALTAVTFASLVLPHFRGDPRAAAISGALCIDFTVTTTLAAYLTLVRPRRAPMQVLIPVFVAGNVLATFLLPAEQRGVLRWIHLAIAPLEVGLLAYVCMLTRRSLADRSDPRDFVERLRATAGAVTGYQRLGDIVAYELALLGYALNPRRAPEPRTHDFTAHRSANAGVLLVGLMFAILVETTAVHLLLSRWSTAAAWITTGLSLYALLWLLGDFRALCARHTHIAGDRLRLRIGMRWEANIPLDLIADASADDGPMASVAGVLAPSRLTPANVRIALRVPVQLIGPYGIRRSVHTLRLRVDEPGRLLNALTARADANPLDSIGFISERPE